MATNRDYDNSVAGATLIRSYGEYWSKDAVDWKSKKLLGHRRKYKVTVKNPTAKEKLCDAWEQRGIYALYKDFKLVYVGLASSSGSGIGSRLHSHSTKHRMKERWDTFSWFGIDGYDAKGNLKRYVGGSVSALTISRTLELVAILVADPPMNRSQGKFEGAERIVQAPTHSSDSPGSSVAEQLTEIKNLLAELKKSRTS